MIKHHKYKNSRWSQNPGAGRARVHCTSLPCPPTPPKPVGKSQRAVGTAHGHVPICGCCALPLCLQGLPGGEKKKNVQRAREREKGKKMHVHSNCPTIGISAFWSGCSVLGTWLGCLWSVGWMHPPSLIFVAGGCLAVLFYLAGLLKHSSFLYSAFAHINWEMTASLL